MPRLWRGGHASGYRPASSEHGVEPHVLPHLGPLLLVVHQEFAVAEVLTLLLVLRPPHHATPVHAGHLAAALVPLPEPGGRLLAERLDDLILERDEELRHPRVALPGATPGE